MEAKARQILLHEISPEFIETKRKSIAMRRTLSPRRRRKAVSKKDCAVQTLCSIDIDENPTIAHLEHIIEAQQMELERLRGDEPLLDLSYIQDLEILQEKYGQSCRLIKELQDTLVTKNCQIYELGSILQSADAQLKEKKVKMPEKETEQAVDVPAATSSCHVGLEQIQSLIQEIKQEQNTSKQANKVSLVLAAELTTLRERYITINKRFEQVQALYKTQNTDNRQLKDKLASYEQQIAELTESNQQQTDLIEQQRNESMAQELLYKKLEKEFLTRHLPQ